MVKKPGLAVEAIYYLVCAAALANKQCSPNTTESKSSRKVRRTQAPFLVHRQCSPEGNAQQINSVSASGFLVS